MHQHLSQFFTKDVAERGGFTTAELNLDPQVTGLEYDSRKVEKGYLFFALPGLHTDGSLYIKDAIKNGAAVIVHENEIADKDSNIVYLKTKNARFAMSPVSAAYYNYPSRDLLITGITGTEGKSTTTYLVWQLLGLLGKKAGFISTVQHCLGGDVLWNSEHQTTPEAPVVQRLLREMADKGCEYAVLESSSHGLSPRTNRLGDVEFCSGVLTNLTHDHLEFHGTWEQYRDDKANLFRALNRWTLDLPGLQENKESFSARSLFFGPFGVVNADDKSSTFFINATQHKVFTFSPGGRYGDIILEAIKSNAGGNWYSVFIPALKEHINIRDNLPGAYNSANVLAAILVISGLLKLPLRDITPFVKYLKPVKGRMTNISKGQPYEVVVDFAHTPSSYQTIFPPLRARLNKTGGRIISLFGSAGERDILKRAEQGQIAALYSDIIIITDEDPRSENPMSILEEIAKGVTSQNKNIFKRSSSLQNSDNENLFLIPDRPLAIRKALSLARKNDLVLMLGKGHENSIIYSNHVMPYDEITEAEKALDELGFNL
ncbi:MAG: UDP-N-acetylmuramoyl-L-alanyl-D-glutamate--2,6-diaminopimelate ligase [Treponema sp.]|nr:UDP-N-acetylmuramoyl-L-alanyl-D-glutamate--2,6-diaminopimelate ligase [Treponema sp.]